ncbi:MAG: hypothetical protein ACK56I_27440, partial [bacterium]
MGGLPVRQENPLSQPQRTRQNDSPSDLHLGRSDQQVCHWCSATPNNSDCDRWRMDKPGGHRQQEVSDAAYVGPRRIWRRSWARRGIPANGPTVDDPRLLTRQRIRPRIASP